MELSVRYKYTNISTVLLQASGRSLVASFVLGLYLVLAPTAHATAFTVCMISSGALVFGNMEVWQMLCGLNTARARLGIRALLATWSDLAPRAGVFMLFGFVSLIVSNIQSPSNNRQSGQDSFQQSPNNIVERGQSWIYFGKLINCSHRSPIY